MHSASGGRWRRWTLSLFTAGLLFSGLGPIGCAHPEPPSSNPHESFAYLYERQLSDFEHDIVTAEHVGDDGPWTRVGRAWLDLVNCTGLEDRTEKMTLEDWPDDEPLAGLMYASLALEMRRQGELALDGAPLDADLYVARWADGDFFDREARPEGDDLIRWPAEDERWSDEGPARVEVEGHCDDLQERLLEAARDEANAESAPTASELHRRFERAQLEAADAVVELGARLPEEEAAGGVALLDFRARLYGARARLDMAEEEDKKEEAEGHLERGYEMLEGLERNEEASSARVAQMLFLRARLASDLGEEETALADVEAALDEGLERTDRFEARYLALRILTDQARWKEALAIAEGMPSKDAPIFAAYAYRKALAARQLEADDRYLRVAIEALTSVGDDSPFAEGLYRETLEFLAEYPFDERVVEVVEEMGPPGGLYVRLADLGGVALDRGYPEHAEAIARWLLERHEHPRYQPRYRAMLASAAFLQDDVETFRRQVRLMTRRHDHVDEALEERAADFYADADKTFSRLMTRMLPTMAEWDETPAEKQRRQRWLQIAVDEVQRFLRAVDESSVESDLVDLYRLASELLEEHPRGYASRVGDKQATPLVLGTVQVGRGELIDEEPSVAPRIDQPRLLTLVPRPDRPAPQWTFGFAEEGGDDG
ncbi:MAG: hypothetical protein ACOCV2_04795 [Persicimonas sp.]